MGRSISKERRASLIDGRFLIRPYALAGSQWELSVTWLCTLLIAVVFGVEVLTPEAVVGTFALLPILAAAWLLSNRCLAVVTAVAVLLLGGAVVIESRNRPTLVLLALAIALISVVARVYATGLSGLLSSHRHLRPAMPTQAAPWSFDGIDGLAHGVRSLTRRELEVARLAAQGYTATEIGGQLHIVDRTVESHLASTYTKLRIGSRPELIRMASRLNAP